MNANGVEEIVGSSHDLHEGKQASRQAGMVQAGFDATKREVKEKERLD